MDFDSWLLFLSAHSNTFHQQRKRVGEPTKSHVACEGVNWTLREEFRDLPSLPRVTSFPFSFSRRQHDVPVLHKRSAHSLNPHNAATHVTRCVTLGNLREIFGFNLKSIWHKTALFDHMSPILSLFGIPPFIHLDNPCFTFLFRGCWWDREQANQVQITSRKVSDQPKGISAKILALKSCRKGFGSFGQKTERTERVIFAWNSLLQPKVHSI